MGQDTEELTTTPADIEATRANLTRDIDELTDKVSPGRVVERRKEAARSRLGSIRNRVMGSGSDTASDVGSPHASAGETASGVAGTVSQTAQGALAGIEAKTDGNPLAAGLVAFGAGMLISSLIPATRKEAQVARGAVEAAKEHGQPLMDEAQAIGQDIGQNLKGSAADATQQVKSTAQEAAQTIKEEGQSSAQAVKDEAPNS
jgi:gas vesicle protein